jgi:hypothetical protein
MLTIFAKVINLASAKSVNTSVLPGKKSMSRMVKNFIFGLEKIIESDG